MMPAPTRVEVYRHVLEVQKLQELAVGIHVHVQRKTACVIPHHVDRLIGVSSKAIMTSGSMQALHSSIGRLVEIPHSAEAQHKRQESWDSFGSTIMRNSVENQAKFQALCKGDEPPYRFSTFPYMTLYFHCEN